MKKNLYKLFLFALIAIMIFTFTACDLVSGGGNDGKSAYQIWLDEGHAGTESDFLNWLKGETGQSGESGEDGENGEDGLSAYQIWLGKGNIGTESDFLSWLKGEAGKPGEKGEKGDDGEKGDKGEKGEPGEKGEKGEQGEKGESGGSEPGLSAFETYKLYNPGYEGDEEKWINDLANGRLTKYTVTFNTNGGTVVAPVENRFKGDKISAPAEPQKTDYIFAGWFKEKNLLNEWVFAEDVVLADTVLYAKWVEDGNPFQFSPISGTTNCAVSLKETDSVYNLTTVIVPQTAVIQGVEYTVTRVDDYGFWFFYNLKTVILPETVTAIGEYAFLGCDNLTTVYMPKVEKIGSHVFVYCYKIKHIFLPATVTSVNSNALRGTHSTERDYPLNIHIAGSAASTAGWVPAHWLPNELHVIDQEINVIYNSAYTDTKDLNFVANGSVYSVGINNDSRATLQKANLPPFYNGKLVTRVLSFSDCLNLTEVVLPATVTSIQASAFYNCINLERIDLNEVTNIGANAFALTSKLKEFFIPLSVSQMGEGILSVGGSTRANDLTVYVAAAYDQTLSWSNKWKEGSGNIEVIYGWLTRAIVRFDSTGGSGVASRDVRKGDKLIRPASPYKDNYTFAGWYKDQQLTEAWDFDNDVVTEDLILYAAWTDGEQATAGLSYTLINGNTGYMVSKGTAALTGRLVIPAEYDGKPVTAIEYMAFSNISSLGLYSQITSVNIPDSITDLGNQTFYGCTWLTTVTIPAGVTDIGSAFDHCSGLTSINVSADSATFYSENNCVIRKADKVLAMGCKTSIIPDYVTGIGDCAFMGCEGLTSIKIPYGVTFIGESAFAQCHMLTTVIIPDSVQAIGKRAFWNSIRLTNINIPYGVTAINDYTFGSCYALKSIIIPSSVEYIGVVAFNDTGLTSVVIPGSVTEMGSSAFAACDELKSVIFLGSMTTLGFNAFSGCSALESIVLPNGIKVIETNSFNNCTSLANIILPDGLERINESSFVNCTALTGIIIPESVNQISDSAFSGCSNLKSIYYAGTTKEAWDAVYKVDAGAAFKNATVYYYSPFTELLENGNFWDYGDDGKPFTHGRIIWQ